MQKIEYGIQVSKTEKDSKVPVIELSRSKVIIIFSLVLCLGFIMGVASRPEPLVIEKENSQLISWKRLKDIDDNALVLAGEALSVCSEGFNALSLGDYEKLEDIQKRIIEFPSKIEVSKNDRLELLKELGY